jgi:hypothetical protein
MSGVQRSRLTNFCRQLSLQRRVQLAQPHSKVDLHVVPGQACSKSLDLEDVSKADKPEERRLR